MDSNLIDIVIPLGPNDLECIPLVVELCKKNIKCRNIYIVSKDDPGIGIWISENTFPFKISDIEFKESRKGWYFQQLIKLYSGSVIEGILPNYLVIDADTYFLKPVTFIDPDGVFLFNTGTEFHREYFTHMNKIHPSMKKTHPESGICHHMLFNKDLLSEMFQVLSPDEPFWITFMKHVNQKEMSGASEYEMYFTYLVLFHPNKMRIRKLQWKNVSRFGYYSDLDYISVHWYIRQR